MDKYKHFQKTIKKYDVNKLTREGTELFDIAQKHQFYRIRAKKWYLKLLYQTGYTLTLFLAEINSKHAIKNNDEIKTDT